MSQLCQGDKPAQVGIDLFGPGHGQRLLGREQIQDAPHTLSILSQSDLGRLAGAGQKICGGFHPLLGREEITMGREDFEYDRLFHVSGLFPGGLCLGPCPPKIVLSREAGKDRDLQKQNSAVGISIFRDIIAPQPVK